MPPLLDLVLDSKLNTEFRDGTTTHTFIEPSGRNRRVSRTEDWKLERHLGRGGFGYVQLETCIAGQRKGMLRAVKIIRKQSVSTRGGLIGFEKELEAITKFSQKRVRLVILQMVSWF
jgi:hypothetical protein